MPFHKQERIIQEHLSMGSGKSCVENHYQRDSGNIGIVLVCTWVCMQNFSSSHILNNALFVYTLE